MRDETFDQTCSFRFMDDELHRRMLALLKKHMIKHVVNSDGVIHYSVKDEEIVGNELIATVRASVFPSWQLLSCPADWTERYKRHMNQHGVPFREERFNNELCFLLPRKYRPHSWELEERANTHPIRKRCDVALVRRLCDVLVKNRRAKTLADEILRDLATGSISDSACRRLSRWCNPARSEPVMQPLAAKLSVELFGHVMERLPA